MEEITDFLGTPVVEGAMIVYASMVGRSPRLTLGEVMSVKHKQTTYYKYAIKVQPLADSYGTYRFKEFKYDREAGTGELVDKPARPVMLHFNDRLMVIT
jgi:hypothetical protein